MGMLDYIRHKTKGQHMATRSGGTRLDGLWARLVAHVPAPENEQACWISRMRHHNGYCDFNIRHNGHHRKLRAHRAMLVLMQIEQEGDYESLVGPTFDDFLQLYDLYSYARFEVDHRDCLDGRCINPDHLQWLTPEQHRNKTGLRRAQQMNCVARRGDGTWIAKSISGIESSQRSGAPTDDSTESRTEL